MRITNALTSAAFQYIPSELQHVATLIEEATRGIKDNNSNNNVSRLLANLIHALGFACTVDYAAEQHVDHFDLPGTYAIVLFLGKPGTTQNFAFPAYNRSVTLQPGDVLIFDPYVLHGMESMEGAPRELASDGRVCISWYTNRLTLEHLAKNGFVGKYAWT